VRLLQRAMHQEQLEARRRLQMFMPQRNPVTSLVEEWRRSTSPQVEFDFLTRSIDD
jgi:hypothetical protein